MRERLVGYLAIGTATLAWGSLPVVVAAADAPAPLLVALRMGIGALALAVVLAVFYRGRAVPRRSRALLAALGATLAVHWVVFFVGLQLIGAAAVLIGYVFPVLVALTAPVVIGEPRERHVLPLAFVGLAGLSVIMAPELGAGRPVGVLAALAAAASGTALILGARRLVETVPGPVIAFWQYLVGALLLVPWAVASVDGRGVPWAWGLLLGVVLTAGAGLLFYVAIARLPAQETGVLMYIEPVAAVVFVWIMKGVPPAWTDVVGGALVVASGGLLVGMSARAAGAVTAEPVVS
ncbi:MAG TPA: DMT family transporter [Actinomycetota bacterium]|nr:DMT family transporter [Actinomycetota bacterium]